MPTPFLSKPAARPKACGKRSPIASTGRPATSGTRRVTGAAARIARNAAWWARSGSARVSTWSKSRR